MLWYRRRLSLVDPKGGPAGIRYFHEEKSSTLRKNSRRMVGVRMGVSGGGRGAGCGTLNSKRRKGGYRDQQFKKPKNERKCV